MMSSVYEEHFCNDNFKRKRHLNIFYRVVDLKGIGKANTVAVYLKQRNVTFELGELNNFKNLPLV